jgi:hypothetical protein
MSVLTASHEYELEQLARLTHIKRQVAEGKLGQLEALAQLQQLNIPGVQVVVAASDPDLVASIGAPPDTPPQASRPLALRDRMERKLRGHYEEWKR